MLILSRTVLPKEKSDSHKIQTTTQKFRITQNSDNNAKIQNNTKFRQQHKNSEQHKIQTTTQKFRTTQNLDNNILQTKGPTNLLTCTIESSFKPLKDITSYSQALHINTICSTTSKYKKIQRKGIPREFDK